MNIKENLTFLIDYIDKKLQTTEGRLALLISGSLITGAAIVHAYNKDINYEELLITKTALETKYNRLDSDYRTKIETADSDCNERIRAGALFHQEMKEIYEQKTAENKQFIKEQSLMEKEKQQIVKLQDKNIKELSKLTQ